MPSLAATSSSSATPTAPANGQSPSSKPSATTSPSSRPPRNTRGFSFQAGGAAGLAQRPARRQPTNTQSVGELSEPIRDLLARMDRLRVARLARPGSRRELFDSPTEPP